MEAKLVLTIGEIDLDPVSPCHTEAKLLGILAHLVVVNRQPAAKDDLIQAVQGGAAETILLGEGRQWRGGRECRDTENELVIRVNVFFETELSPIDCDRKVRQVQITAAGDLVSEYFATGKAKFLEDASFQSLIKHLVGTPLNRQIGIFQKPEVFDFVWVIQIDEDSHSLACVR